MATASLGLARITLRTVGLRSRAAASGGSRFLRRWPAAIGAAAALLLAVLIALATAIFGNPHGGEARAVISLGERPVPPPDALMSLVEDAGKPQVVEPHRTASTSHGTRSSVPLADRSPPTSASIAPDGTVTLAPAPDLSLLAEGPFGLLPVIAPDGRRAAEVYARPVPPPSGRPRIAILLSGMGLSASATRTAIGVLPGEVTFAFAPHGEGLQSWVNRARAQGHEVMLELPLEPFDYPENDPGPYTLLANAPMAENVRRLEWTLSRFAGYIGVVSQGGHRFTASEEAIGSVLAAIASRGLIFVEDGASPRSQSLRMAQANAADALIADRQIDDRLSREAIDLKLLDLEKVAASRGVAVGAGFAYPVTVAQIAAWIPTLKAKGFDLVPVSDAALRRSAP